jgi:hypothetical protein
MAADRGLAAAQESGNLVVTGSLFRSVAHCLPANGRPTAARDFVVASTRYLESGLADASPTYLSIYGTLFLVGAMAAARIDDRAGRSPAATCTRARPRAKPRLGRSRRRSASPRRSGASSSRTGHPTRPRATSCCSSSTEASCQLASELRSSWTGWKSTSSRSIRLIRSTECSSLDWPAESTRWSVLARDQRSPILRTGHAWGGSRA